MGKTREFNVGLDFGFLNNRISGTIDWYNKVSRDLLMEQMTPLELGSSTGAMMNNVGKVKNTGLEIALTTTNVQTKNFFWSTTFSFSTNKNEILELNGGKEDLVANNGSSDNLSMYCTTMNTTVYVLPKKLKHTLTTQPSRLSSSKVK